MEVNLGFPVSPISIYCIRALGLKFLGFFSRDHGLRKNSNGFITGSTTDSFLN